ITYVSDDGAGTYNSESGLWSIGDISNGITVQLKITATVNIGTSEQSIINTASILMADQSDPDLTNNVASALIIPTAITDLSISKTIVGDTGITEVGSIITFEINVENRGPLDATEVIVMDLLPSGYTYESYNATSGTYDEYTGIWSVGSILENETAVLLVHVLVNAAGDYENCATMSSLSQIDADATNNQSCIKPDPIAIIDLELTKEVDDLEPLAGTNVNFTITVANIGPSNATQVQVLESLPSGLEFVSYTATSGTYSVTTGIWDIETIDAATEQELIITASVLSFGDWHNVAEIISVNELDIDSTPNNQDMEEDDMDEVLLNPMVELTIPNGFTPNGDGINEEFVINNLEVLYPNFSMEIINRWGNSVYKYSHNGNIAKTPRWWDGYSSGRMTLNNNERVPTGTYFYSIYFNVNGKKPHSGWVYLRR
ncbi:MAG: DUF11 domain-containing protein, partial [Flavobacteriaceae bacterium]|nr:DUF11 domain-containing protein [Flavobacteriaceae bacterium]